MQMYYLFTVHYEVQNITCNNDQVSNIKLIYVFYRKNEKDVEKI